MTSGPAPILRARQVSYGFSPGSTFLGPLDMELAQGGFCAVVGPNGAGKSTLLRLLVGLLTPQAGTIDFLGRPLAGVKPPERARRMAFVPQHPESPQTVTAGQVVLLGRFPFRTLRLFDSAGDIEVVRQAMETTGVLEFADRPMDTLSGGEAQRVHLAAALAQEPSLLVLDEPTSGLDLFHQLSIFGLLSRLCEDQGVAVIAVTHDLNLAAQHCDQAIVLDRGRLACAGQPETVLVANTLERVYGVGFAAVAVEGSHQPWLVPRLPNTKRPRA